MLEAWILGATGHPDQLGLRAHQLLHTPETECWAQHLPIRIEFVETPEKVDEGLAHALLRDVSDDLIEVQDTIVVKLARKPGKAGAQPSS